MLALIAILPPGLRAPPVVPRCGVARCCADASRQMSEIQQTVAAQPVVVYSKSWCPFCTECKELLDSMEQPYTVVELDQRDDGDAVQAALLSLTRQRTVPNVFVGGQHLGGNDDTQAAPTNPAPAPAPDRRPTAGRTPNADPDRSPKQAAARSGRLAEMLAGSGSGVAAAAADAREVDLPANRARRVNLGLAVASPLVAAALFFAQRSSLLGVDPVTLLAKMEAQSPALPAALANGRPTVVDFYAPWCESCKVSAPGMYRLERLYADKINYVVINGDDARNANLVQRFGVDGIPHLALISADRKLVGTLIGEVPEAVLESNLRALAAGAALPYASTNAQRQ